MAADDIEGKLTVMLNLIILKKEIAFLMASTFFVITAFDHLRITKEVIVSQILTKRGDAIWTVDLANSIFSFEHLVLYGTKISTTQHCLLGYAIGYNSDIRLHNTSLQCPGLCN